MLDLLGLAGGYATVAAFIFALNQWVRSSLPERLNVEVEASRRAVGSRSGVNHDDSKQAERNIWFSAKKSVFRDVSGSPIGTLLVKFFVSEAIYRFFTIITLIVCPMLFLGMILDELKFWDTNWAVTLGVDDTVRTWQWRDSQLTRNGVLVFGKVDVVAVLYAILLLNVAYTAASMLVWLKAIDIEKQNRKQFLGFSNLLDGRDTVLSPPSDEDADS